MSSRSRKVWALGAACIAMSGLATYEGKRRRVGSQ